MAHGSRNLIVSAWLLGASIFGALGGCSAPGGDAAAASAAPGSADADASGSASSSPDAGAGGDASATGPIRLGPERLGTLRSTIDAPAAEALRPLRCPEGALVVGLDVPGPDPDGGLPGQDEVASVRLRCATLDAAGVLGAPSPAAEALAELPPGYTYFALDCPSQQVATRLTGTTGANALDTPIFRSMGLRCQPLGPLADRGAITAGSASTPPSLGARPGSGAFDDACEEGSALGGLALEWLGTWSGGGLAAFRTVAGLCREILVATLPGGEPLDPSRPVSLGALRTPLPLATNSGGLPSATSTLTRDCPSGGVVVAVNGGRTDGNGPGPLLDLQLTCRGLRADGSLAGSTEVGGAAYARASTCLRGSAVTGLDLTKVVLGGQHDFAEDVRVACAVPVPVGARASSPLPRWAPGYGPFEVDAPPWATSSCPAGSVLTGVTLYAPFVSPTERTLGGVQLRCRDLIR